MENAVWQIACAPELFLFRFRRLQLRLGFFFGEEALYLLPLGVIGRCLQQVLKPLDVYGVGKGIHGSLHRYGGSTQAVAARGHRLPTAMDFARYAGMQAKAGGEAILVKIAHMGSVPMALLPPLPARPRASGDPEARFAGTFCCPANWRP